MYKQRVRRLFLLALVACGQPAAHSTTPPPAPHGDPSCPVEVPGTSVTVEDMPTGAALVFVTTGDVTELQSRAKTFSMVQTESQRTVDNIDHGARITYAAKPEQISALQSELRMHAQHLATGSCKMAM